ncbi:MAG TPA: TMEM175 family protein [Streptosporangiaceae bacterium]|nr:TMEM175 family protein [Streptosporangiaceae bacterium]
MGRSRLEAFSDGVFAVAITLLALNFTGIDSGKPDLLKQIRDMGPTFLAYAVSFLMIGIIWVNHHVLFAAIRKIDRTVLFLNLVLLLFVVLIPYTTSTVALYRLHDSPDGRVAVAQYALAFLGMSLGFSGIFEWTLHGQHRKEPLPPEAHWPARVRFVSGGLVYVIAFAVALVNAVASFVIIAVVAVYYVIERTPAMSSQDGEADQDDEDS